MWNKKVHVKSSMERKDSQWSLFIGRWQPLHEAHKQLFQQVLDDGGRVCIAVRDGEVNEKNPFTTKQVFENISKEYWYNESVQVIIVPDISSVNFGRGVGYDIIEYIPPSEVAEISATKIRKELGL
jgi:phosphopantetheine adenylyltransferase